MREKMRSTAAWRISIWTTLAFAVGTAIAFSVVYAYVANNISEHIDTWLSGEAEVLAEVSANTPRDTLYNRLVEEVAELAEHEVPEERDPRGNARNAVFFLQKNSDGRSLIWVGPQPKDLILQAVAQTHFEPGAPQALRISRGISYRVAMRHGPRGDVYLGLSDRGARSRLHLLTRRFVYIWGVVALFGFLISYLSARRTLSRVERITETVAHIGTEDLSARLPEPSNSDEISRLARTFNHMLGRIQTSVSQLRAVTDAVAHDMKSPVTAIRGRLEAALLNEDQDKWQEPVAQAIEGLDRLSQLLNTTLDLAEAEAGALRLERVSVDLSAAIRQVAELYRPALADHGHRLVLDLEDHVVIEADRGLLNRVLSNLLDNELVHVPGGGEVHVRLRSQGDAAELVVEDEGPGFPADIGSRAFERFVKGKHSPGHGLGLAFVDAIVQAHGGKVRISRRDKRGAVITLTFPAQVLQPA
jgi:signal transduction histidine kinase